MDREPLKVVATERKSGGEEATQKRNLRVEAEAKFDRLWHSEPERFDYSGNEKEKLRLLRTLELIEEKSSISGKSIVDLGCGKGYLAREMAKGGACRVDAVDISKLALKELEGDKGEVIHPRCDYVPRTLLDDESYDIVIATELIAELDESQYRLFFSELARLVKREGFVVCSTAIDLSSEDALQRFADLASTELEVIKWRFSYHYLAIKFADFFAAPSRFLRAASDPRFRKEMLKSSTPLSKWWFRINSSKPLSFFWRLLAPLSSPLSRLFVSNRPLLLALERATKALFSESGISDALFIAKRRPLAFPPEKRPHELKHKKEVWE